MGMIFIPLMTLNALGDPAGRDGQCQLCLNLVRNLGGSLGIAFVTTMLARRSQFHQSRLVEHLTPFDANFWSSSQQAAEMLQRKGMAASLRLAGRPGSHLRATPQQASMMSFNDVFQILAVMMLCMLPLVLFMKHIRHGPEPAPEALPGEKAAVR